MDGALTLEIHMQQRHGHSKGFNSVLLECVHTVLCINLVLVSHTETPASTQGMTIQAPVCETDGSYRREQRAGGLTWCVDARGRPLHHTLTRGHVHCGNNGE